MIDQPPAIVDVLTDHGGTLGERFDVIEWLRRNGIAVRIVGVCASACAFLLPSSSPSESIDPLGRTNPSSS